MPLILRMIGLPMIIEILPDTMLNVAQKDAIHRKRF